MILLEIDPKSSEAEIFPILRDIFAKIENGTISIQEALLDLEKIQSDVIMRARLSATNQKEAYEWQFLLLTIKNIIESLNED